MAISAKRHKLLRGLTEAEWDLALDCDAAVRGKKSGEVPRGHNHQEKGNELHILSEVLEDIRNTFFRETLEPKRS